MNLTRHERIAWVSADYVRDKVAFMGDTSFQPERGLEALSEPPTLQHFADGAARLQARLESTEAEERSMYANQVPSASAIQQIMAEYAGDPWIEGIEHPNKIYGIQGYANKTE